MSNELEQAAEKYAEKHSFRVPYDGSNKFYDDADYEASKKAFIEVINSDAAKSFLFTGGTLPTKYDCQLKFNQLNDFEFEWLDETKSEQLKQVPSDEEIKALAKENGCSGVENIFIKGFKAALTNNAKP